MSRLKSLGLPSQLYTLAGIRAGGATYRFLCDEEISKLQRRGRWTSARTLEHYLQPAVAFLSTSSWSEDSKFKVIHLASCPQLAGFLAQNVQVPSGGCWVAGASSC